jgi:hypothetical protein
VPQGGYPAFFLSGAATKSVTSTFQSDGARSFAGSFCGAVAAGSNYVWIQTAGHIPSACASTAAGNNLTVTATGEFIAIPSGAVSTAVAGVTYALTHLRVVGVGLQLHSGRLADIQLLDR